MDLLGPHVHSRHGLQFDVIYSSSLPSLCRDLCGLVSELWELWLNCMVEMTHVIRPRFRVWLFERSQLKIVI